MTNIENTQDEQQGCWTVSRVTIATLVSFFGLYLLIFVIGIVAALFNAEGSASFFGYFNNLLTIALTIISFVVIVAIGILVIQIARFVNLLRSEVKPITNDTKQAIRNVRTTSEFVQQHGVSPVIKTQSFIVGLIAFFREIVRITRILQGRPSEDKANEE